MMRSCLWWSLLPLTAVLAADECGLYFAVSSTSTVNDPKWGVYAGVDYEVNTQLGPPDIALQLHNLMANNMGDDDEDDDDDDDDKRSLRRLSAEMIERYTWVPDSSGGLFEIHLGKLNTAITGIGLHAAFNGGLTNAGFNHSSSYFRPSLGETPGLAHPGRGASSQFYNVALQSLSKVPAGHEIFMDYGENFEAEDDEDAQLTAAEHEKVDQLVDSMIEFMDKYEHELDEKSKKEIYKFLVHDVMSAAAGPQKGKRVADVLPDSPDDLRLVKEAGGSLVFGSPKVKRDIEWLKNEGICMDNMELGASTIPNAGRGAFAKRAIAKDATIAPVPLLQIPDKAAMDMHEIEEDGGRYFRKNDKVIHQQLLLNYCYGHPESSMLFLPTGSIVPFVNHDSKSANAKLVWSTHSAHQSHWLDLAPEQLVAEENQYIGLLMELVATKNIAEGDEVFLDYGAEWQAAWDAHVKDWDAKVASGDVKSEWPLRALDMNELYRSKPFETPSELAKQPYPENIALMCFLAVDDDDDDDDDEDDDAKTWRTPMQGTIYETSHLFPCAVKERVDIESDGTFMPYNYTVTTTGEEVQTIKHVPHQALIFVDEAETSDQFARDSFRHPIGIPDDLFPKGPWRDLTAVTRAETA